MISVLIPVYNTSVVELVQELSRQLENLDIEGEILVLDDASSEEYRQQNRRITQLARVVYNELEQNAGRLQIRKFLSLEAKYSWLIFLDGDSRIINSSFIKEYADSTQSANDVIIGGRVYQKEKPQDCSRVLHWKYGHDRENIVQRKKGFHTNNFCIKKHFFDQLSFDTSLHGYGHEDTWIGMQLEKIGAKITYIDNPIVHDGIENADVFIQKSLHALQNLSALSRQVTETVLRDHVKLFDHYCKLKRSGMASAVKMIYKRTKKTLEKNLTSCKPSLFLFDFYRLANFILINDQPKTGL